MKCQYCGIETDAPCMFLTSYYGCTKQHFEVNPLDDAALERLMEEIDEWEEV